MITLTFLGTFEVKAAGAVISAFRTDKTRALLTYLALEAMRPQRRERLAALFWPESDHESALYNLRLTLHRVRQTLDATAPGVTDALFTVTRSTITFHASAAQVDVLQFQQLVGDCETHSHEDLTLCADCLASLHQAVMLYRGELLAGFGLADAPEFEEWLLLRRETLQHLALLALHNLAVAYETQGAYERALAFALRKLALDPYREETHQQVMRLLARSGLISQALAQYERCRRLLREEVGVEPDAETVALAEQIRAGKFDKAIDVRNPQVPSDRGTPGDQHSALPISRSELELSPHPASPSPSHNLPRPPTPFVGRARELAEIIALLQRPDVQLVTLVGTGGMGKSRIAIEVGQSLVTTFADGVFFVALAALVEPSAIAPAIATALGLTLHGDLHGALRHTLRSKELLLILDNFEHLLPASLAVLRTGDRGDADRQAVELVADLLQASPGLRILATARERLNLRAEHLYPVEGLRFDKEATLADAQGAAAVRLFVQSAQHIHPRFTLHAANLSSVLHICQLVQGMPLGLELAAAQVGMQPLNAIADAIAQSAEFLAVDWHDLPERQRSMRAVFAWSWQLLTPEERRALRQISIFQGGFDIMAAQAVTGATLPLLRRLCNKSMIQWQTTATGEVRYTMHELLRQFAAEELRAAGEGPAVATSHGGYYLAFLAARGLRLGRREPKEASSEIQAELDNIRMAWQWAATQGRLAELEQATYSWWQFCILQGLDAEGQLSFANAVTGVRSQLAATAGDAETRLPGQRLLAKLLAIHANTLFGQGYDEEMAAQAREAVALGAASGGIEGETFGTFVLGRALQDLGQNREAGELWQQTIQLVRRYHPNHPESELLHETNWMAHNWLHGVALHFGDYASSRAYMVQALQICQTLGKRQGEITCLSDLAHLNFLLYDFAAAEVGFAAALNLARALSFRAVEMLAQEGLAGVLRLRGDYTTARTLLEQAVVTATILGFHYDEALILAALIRLHCQLGDEAAAEQRHEQLTQLLARVKLPRECQLYGYLAAATRAHYAGDHPMALHYAEQANQLNQGGEILFRRVDTALILGHTRAAVGQWDAAAAAFQLAIAAFQQFDNRALAAEPQAGLAYIALAQGDLAGALAQVEAILPVLAASGRHQPHAGYNDPFFIYLTCYQVLAAHADLRAASLLQQGYDLLQHDAATLDEATRQRFLQVVPNNCSLIAAYQAWRVQRDSAIG